MAIVIDPPNNPTIAWAATLDPGHHSFSKWAIGIPGIKRLAVEFESRGFSTRKSLQYLQDGDLDYAFPSPKRLLLAEKRGLDHELRQLKLKSQEPGSTAHLMPKQLQFSR